MSPPAGNNPRDGIGSYLWSWQRAQPTDRPRKADAGRRDHVVELVVPGRLELGLGQLRRERPGAEEAGRRHAPADRRAPARRRRSASGRTGRRACPRLRHGSGSRDSDRRAAGRSPARSRATRQTARRPSSAAPSARRNAARRAGGRPADRRRRAQGRRRTRRPPRASAAGPIRSKESAADQRPGDPPADSAPALLLPARRG